ncbi:unnamed protein product [Urochloa humidicola]
MEPLEQEIEDSTPSQMNRNTNIALVQQTEGLKQLENDMRLSLIATPTAPTSTPPNVHHIYQAIIEKCGHASIPTKVTGFAPDFILHFKTKEIRNRVLKCKILQNDSITVELKAWRSHYRSETIAWTSKVEITITQIPSHACHKDILPPLLSKHCDIRSHKFNTLRGIATIIAFTSSPSAIPEFGTIAYPVRTPTSTQLKTYPVRISTRAIPINPIEDAFVFAMEDIGLEAYNYKPELLLAAYENGADPQELLYNYESIEEAEDIMSGCKRNRDEENSTDSSSDYEGYKETKYDYSPGDDLSDREPADWKGKNI